MRDIFESFQQTEADSESQGAAMPFTLAQVSDPHLGAGVPLFRGNFDRILRSLEETRPALVVASGDVSRDGADSDADLVFAAAQFGRMPAPVHVIPGNHDVGDHRERTPTQPVTDERLGRYRQHMGPDRWIVDCENWRLLGLNSQVMGTHFEEADQAEMIERALATAGDRRLAVFIHKPFFTADPDETEFGYWSVPPFARAALRPILAHPHLRLVASGHLHLHHEESRGAVRFAWCPSCAFVVAAEHQAGLPGERRCAFLLHRFDADSVETSLVQPPGMECLYSHEIG